MSNETSKTKTSDNAQDGNAVLLSKNADQIISEILNEVRHDWQSLGKDSDKQKEFIRKEVHTWGRAHLRCGYLIHEIDTKKLYKEFGHASVATLLKELCHMRPPDVSKAKHAFAYAEPISKALPSVTMDDLNEAQMRQLRSTVKQLHPNLKGEEKIKRAVELYTEINNEKPIPSAIDIKRFGEKKLKERQKAEEEDKEAAVQSDQSGGESDDVGNDEEKQGSSSEHDLMPHKGTVLEDSDFDEPQEDYRDRIIDKDFANELSSLFGYILDKAFLDKETESRIKDALKRLGSEFQESADEAEGGDDE